MIIVFNQYQFIYFILSFPSTFFLYLVLYLFKRGKLAGSNRNNEINEQTTNWTVFLKVKRVLPLTLVVPCDLSCYGT